MAAISGSPLHHSIAESGGVTTPTSVWTFNGGVLETELA